MINKANNGNVKKTQKFNQSSTEKSSSSKTTVKVNAMWYFVASYLEMLNSTCAVFDEEFAALFKRLVDYVDGKINIPNVKNVLDEYVVYEVEV